jgi:hypothetical protein
MLTMVHYHSYWIRISPAADPHRLRSQGGQLSNAWMSVIPHRALRTDIEDSDYRLLLRWWMGLPILPTGRTLPACPLCGDPVDAFGDHFVCCEKNGITQRHHALRDAIFDVLARGAIPAAKEVVSAHRNRPADILLVAWERGRDVAVDVTVTHPLAPSCYPLVLQRVGQHCRRAETNKVTAEAEMCREVGWGFMPAAFTPWGGSGPTARSLLYEIGRLATAALEGWPKQRRLREIQETISLTLARATVRQLRLRNRVQDACVDDDDA